MVVSLLALGASAASLVGFYFWGKASGGRDFGQEILTNTTIESEEKKNVSTWFYFDFEDGNNTLLFILGCGLLVLIVLVACCLCFFGCPCCRCTRCKRNENENHTTEVIEMRSTEHDRNEHDRNNGRQNHHCDTVATNHHYETVNDSQEDNTTSNISKFDEMVGSLYSFIV